MASGASTPLSACGVLTTALLISSNDDRDAPEGSLKSVFRYDGGYVTHYIVSTRLVSSTSCLPLHDLCICTEAARVGQMIYCLKRERATMYEFKTDSVLYRPLKRKRTNVLEALMFRGLTGLRDRYEASHRRLGGALRADAHPL